MVMQFLKETDIQVQIVAKLVKNVAPNFIPTRHLHTSSPTGAGGGLGGGGVVKRC